MTLLSEWLIIQTQSLDRRLVKKNKNKIKKKSETSIVNTFSYLFASMWKNEIKMQAFG